MSAPKPVLVSEVFAAAAKKIRLERLARDLYLLYCAESSQFGLEWSELLEQHRNGWRQVARYCGLDKE